MAERENQDDEVIGGEFDLFGNPLEPIRDRRGRPSFQKSKENQDFVAVRAAAGWKQSMIAAAIGCDEKTLRKHFSRELQHGQLIVEGMCLDVLMRRVREGHTPSVRQLQSRMDAVAPLAPKRPKANPEPDDPPLGKKEQAIRAAQDVPDDWGDIRARRNH